VPEKTFIIRVSESVLIFVWFATDKGKVGSFVVKLNIIFDEKIIELARYDSGLHGPHLDILAPDGSKRRVIDYGMLAPRQ